MLVTKKCYNKHLAKSLAYLSFIVLLLQILQKNCKISKRIYIFYAFGKTEYLSMCLLTFLPKLSDLRILVDVIVKQFFMSNGIFQFWFSA